MSDESFRSGVVIAGMIVLSLLAAASVALQGVALVLLTVRLDVDDPPDLDFRKLFEDHADAAIDAGFGTSPTDLSDPLLEQRKIFLGHNVNSRTASAVVERLIYLDRTDPAVPIDLYLSTQGGFADNAFAIIDTMRLIEAPVNTWAIGGCYSAGTMILTAGTGRRFATTNAIVMVHANGDEPAGKFSFADLDRARDERLWRETASLPDDWYPMKGNKLYYLSPSQALEFGVIDEIVEPDADPVGAPAGP